MEKATMGFCIYKISQILKRSDSLELFIKYKPLFSEECSTICMMGSESEQKKPFHNFFQNVQVSNECIFLTQTLLP